jgi:AcrR family transcriptional regulator
MSRTKDPDTGRRILAATVELMCQMGIDRMSVEQVAALSGAAKTSIYRRWPTKAALVIDAVSSVMNPPVTPDTGSLRDDLVAYFTALTSDPRSDLMTRLFLAILDTAQRDPELDRLRMEIVANRRRPVRTVLELAQLRGQINSSIDIDLATELLLSVATYRRFVLREPLLDDHLEATIDLVLGGLVTPLVHPTT